MEKETTNHRSLVENVQKQVKKFYKEKKKARIYHGGTNSTRIQTKDRSHLIDVSQLNNVIEINIEEKFVLVESNVSLGNLVDLTQPLGYIPPVVSEFPSITVGGAIQGGAGESSSFRFGCFNDTSLEYEVILGNGKRVVASPKVNSDIFYSLPSSCGTLGIITMVKLPLIPVTKMVRLEYHYVSSFDEAVGFIDRQTKKTQQPDFIDGIMFSVSSGVIVLGYLTEAKNFPTSSFHKLHDEWFYIHAQKVTSREKVYEEIVPIVDYLFRYDRGAFWAAREGFKELKIPFNRLTRFMLSPILKTKTVYRFLHDARLGQRFLVQDLCMPKENTVKLLNFNDFNFGIYPLWLCPLKSSTTNFLSPTYIKSDLVINVGIYGRMPLSFDDFVRNNRKLENEVSKLSGRKVMYAHSYYSEIDFWKNYDQHYYNLLRKKYHSEIVFPDIYHKIYVSERYQPSIARGWWKLITQV